MNHKSFGRIAPFFFAVSTLASLLSACGQEGSLDSIGSSQLAVTAWQPGVAYAANEEVTYQGVTYRCVQAHTAQSGWQPPNVAALWQPQGPTNSSSGGASSTPNTNPLTLDYVTLRTDCEGDPASCCTPGSTLQTLSSGADTLAISQDNRCILGLGGDDTIALQSSQPASLLLGPGNDTAIDGPGNNTIWGGTGNDTINGYGGTNLFFGGAGDDTIYAANGQNTVVPGPGRDTVGLGTGDDTLYVFDLCEVVGGETLDGGAGNDTLIIPVPLAQLQSLGVSVAHFEHVVVQQNSCRSECVAQPNCYGHGVCGEGAVSGQMQCICDSGWSGPYCAPTVRADRPRSLPVPPRQVGCYLGTANGWVQTACTPSAQLQVRQLDMGPLIRSVSYTDGAQQTTIPFQFGQLETTLIAFGSEKDSIGNVPDSVSVQLNTNKFVSPSGHEAVFQFALQSDPGLGNSMCIWSIDYTVACSQRDPVTQGCLNGAGYGTHCLGGSATAHTVVPRRPGHFRQYDFASIGASTYDDQRGVPVVGMVVQLSWFDPSATVPEGNGLYSVVAEDLLGLGGGWTEVSGTMLGLGDQSQAVFTDSSLMTRLLAGSCVNQNGPDPDVPWPGVCPNTPELLPHTTLATADITTETNNLLPVGGPTVLASATADLVYTQYLSSSSGACIGGGERAFVRDRPSDTGVVPSNSGGEPFWESPDIFVVPRGSVVSVDGVAVSTVITPGQPYDIYVRVNNDYGCAAVTGAKVLVDFAEPAALSSVWQPVTGGEYKADAAHPNGVTIPAGSRALIGPLPWTAPTSGLGDGHKCLLASLVTDTQPAAGNPLDATGSYQVAQRNMQLSECTYPLQNASGSNGNLILGLGIEGARPNDSGNDLGMSFDDPNAAWYGIWKPAENGYTVTHTNGATKVHLLQNSVILKPVPLAAGQAPAARGILGLAQGQPLTKLALSAVLINSSGALLVKNGGSCTAKGEEVVR